MTFTQIQVSMDQSSITDDSRGQSPFRSGEGVTTAAVDILIINMSIMDSFKAFVILPAVALGADR